MRLFLKLNVPWESRSPEGRMTAGLAMIPALPHQKRITVFFREKDRDDFLRPSGER
jgi:hypothetical protein